MSEVKDAEVVVETNLVPIDNDFAKLVKDADLPVLAVAKSMRNLDWQSMTPPQMAVILMSKPYSIKGGGTTFLTFRQALFYAVRCFELGVSPFGDEAFFDPARFSVNLTLAGKKAVARNKGIDLGPPTFEELFREWKDAPKITDAAKAAQTHGFVKDVGCKCRMRVGDPKNGEYAEYTAWLSEWYVPTSPVWQAKAQHMLCTRATEKAISLALGTGASAMPDEKELE